MSTTSDSASRLSGQQHFLDPPKESSFVRSTSFKSNSPIDGFGLQSELEAILSNAKDETNLRSLLANAILRHQKLSGCCWYSMERRSEPRLLASKLLLRDRSKAVQLSEWMREIAVQSISNPTSQIYQHPNNSDWRACVVHSRPGNGPNGISAYTEAIVVLLPSTSPSTANATRLACTLCITATASWKSQSRSKELLSQLDSATAIIEMVGMLEAADSHREATRILSDTTREYLDASFVAVGLRKRNKSVCEVHTISMQQNHDSGSERVRRIKAALDEAMVHNVQLCHPNGVAHESVDDEPSTSTNSASCQQQLSKDCNLPTVISTPILDAKGEVMGAICVAGALGLSNNHTRNFLSTLAVSAGSSLRCVQRMQRNLISRAYLRLFGNHWKRGFAALFFFACMCLLLMVPLRYRIATRFQCKPTQQRFMVAPFDGLVRASHAETGDHVIPGQLLATLDDRELQFELNSIQAEWQQAKTKRDIFRSNEQIAESIMAELQMDSAESRCKLIRHRLDHLEVRSSIDGVVLAGEMERKENLPVRTGDPLFEIAPIARIEIELAIPAEEIDHVEPGMSVEIRADRDVSHVFEGDILRIAPRSTIVDQRNVFIAVVELDNVDQFFRPGMAGSARIISNEKSLGWILFHRAIDHLISRWSW